ncbi:MAG TPA: DegT/DnrJ/EryC1/StrS family aminotransferase [Vicinamibacterales bacterium]
MIPFVDLQAQYRAIKPELDAAVLRVLENAQFILGPAVAAFESDFAAFCGTTEAIGVNSGTSALHLALLAAGVGPGDEVITVPYTFVATVSAIEYTGARPVFVDVEPGYWTMDPAQIEQAIGPRTKAIVPVHLYGQPADMDPILEIARRRGLAVIEDACQAHGSEYKGRRCGSMGDLGCFSFYPGKNLGAYGEAGAVVTSDASMARRIRLLRAWGEETRYEHKYRGFNYRMDGLQGAVLGVKLKYLERWTEARRAHAAEYSRQLAATPARVPVERPGVRHVYHVYVVQLADRDLWRARLTDAAVQTGVHYPIPVHLQPAYRDLGYDAGAFPVSEAAARCVLSLPMFPELTAAQIAEVAAVLRAPVSAVTPA